MSGDLVRTKGNGQGHKPPNFLISLYGNGLSKNETYPPSRNEENNMFMNQDNLYTLLNAWFKKHP